MEDKDEYIYSLLLSLFLMQGEINRLATAIEKIAKLVEGTYEALDSQALQEIRQIIKEQTNDYR